MSANYPIAVSGLQHIQNWFNPYRPLAALCPSKGKPWQFLFIMLLNMASTLNLQELNPSQKSVDSG